MCSKGYKMPPGDGSTVTIMSIKFNSWKLHQPLVMMARDDFDLMMIVMENVVESAFLRYDSSNRWPGSWASQIEVFFDLLLNCRRINIFFPSPLRCQEIVSTLAGVKIIFRARLGIKQLPLAPNRRFPISCEPIQIYTSFNLEII